MAGVGTLDAMTERAGIKNLRGELAQARPSRSQLLLPRLGPTFETLGQQQDVRYQELKDNRRDWRVPARSPIRKGKILWR